MRFRQAAHAASMIASSCLGDRDGHARRNRHPRDPGKGGKPRHPAAFYYGAASYAVEPPERTGTLHVDAEALMPVAKAMFTGLLRIGFRNIHLVIHHQTENFAAGMPTDLAFKFAARQAIFAFLRGGARRGMVGRGIDGRLLYYMTTTTTDRQSRPTTSSTGSRRILSMPVLGYGWLPVRSRRSGRDLACSWRSCRKA